IPEALQETKASLIYVVNLMTSSGETDAYAASHHVEQIVRYGGRVPDAVLANRGQIPPKLALRYEREKAFPVTVDTENLYKMGVSSVKSRDVMSLTSFVRHDPVRTARALIELFGRLGPVQRRATTLSQGE